MMTMANHIQSQQTHQDANRSRPRQDKQADERDNLTAKDGVINSQQHAQGHKMPHQGSQDNQSESYSDQQRRELQQDGRRTLIKNQLYLIEQLQLENANLRNERDQLQLENEELKFHLQMISSSNILSQPNSAFETQSLATIVDDGQDRGTKLDQAKVIDERSAPIIVKVTNSLASTTIGVNRSQPQAATSISQTEPGLRATSADNGVVAHAGDNSNSGFVTVLAAGDYDDETDINQVKLFATPLRQPVKSSHGSGAGTIGSDNQRFQQVCAGEQVYSGDILSLVSGGTSELSGTSSAATVDHSHPNNRWQQISVRTNVTSGNVDPDKQAINSGGSGGTNSNAANASSDEEETIGTELQTSVMFRLANSDNLTAHNGAGKLQRLSGKINGSHCVNGRDCLTDPHKTTAKTTTTTTDSSSYTTPTTADNTNVNKSFDVRVDGVICEQSNCKLSYQADRLLLEPPPTSSSKRHNSGKAGSQESNVLFSDGCENALTSLVVTGDTVGNHLNHQGDLMVVHRANTDAYGKLDEDEDEQQQQARIRSVAQQYGDDREHIQTAAVIIQRAFRKYQICERFRTITEQLRHHSGGGTSSAGKSLHQRGPPLVGDCGVPKGRKHHQSIEGSTVPAQASLLSATSRSATTPSTTGEASKTNIASSSTSSVRTVLPTGSEPELNSRSLDPANRSNFATTDANRCNTTTTTTTTTTIAANTITNSTSTSAGRAPTTSVGSVPFASGATRAAAWESLSYAASRIAASASSQVSALTSAAVSLATNATSALSPGQATQSNQQEHQQLTNKPSEQTDPTGQIITRKIPIGISGNQSSLQPSNDQKMAPLSLTRTQTVASKHQDQVFAAAINFQQLESIRKRQYRVGLNVFNKNPEKGISFLVAHSFIDTSSPYSKTSASYYHSNQLHFIDKQQNISQTNQHQLAFRDKFQSCLLCIEEDNLKRNIAHFLLHRKGLAKEKIGHYLGNLQVQFNQDVLKYYLQELDFNGLQVDMALRKFLATFRLPGEAQKIEKIVESFAQRYVQCQHQRQYNQLFTQSADSSTISQLRKPIGIAKPHDNQLVIAQSIPEVGTGVAHANSSENNPACGCNNMMMLSKDEIFILTFAIIMLNTDLHSPSLKPTSRMSSSQFVNNLRGVFKSQLIEESDLVEIYDRVKANQIATSPDHVTHVMKVQQGLTAANFQRKELPNLCVPHRRLVCFCRLFEVYDINKKDRVGQHQREIFLFNDMLLVTKLARRVRVNANQLYLYRQTIPLQGLYVQLFQSAHYAFGVKMCRRFNNETVIMFNARNELDQSRFVDDLGESIAEIDEMETIKKHNIIDTIHFKYQERLSRHSASHPTLGDEKLAEKQSSFLIANDNKSDTRNCNDYRPVIISQDGGQMKSDRDQKFKSMMNLSSCDRDGRMLRVTGKENRPIQTGHSGRGPALRQNNERRLHRIGSSGSLHSYDSGMFLSRDVSPNQSS